MFNDQEREDLTIYKVVVNHEEQYSIWPQYRENAPGWNDVGKSGSKAECLEYIKEVWTDMRPLSLRKRMEQAANEPQPAPPTPAAPSGPSLVERLSTGLHRVEFNSQVERTGKWLKQAIDRGYVHLKFPETKGGTTLGVRVDASASEFREANFDDQTGQIHLEGTLTLDYVKVRCIADLLLDSLSGTGRLVAVND